MKSVPLRFPKKIFQTSLSKNCSYQSNPFNMSKCQNYKLENKIDWSLLFETNYQFELRASVPKQDVTIVFDINNVLVTYENRIADCKEDLKKITSSEAWRMYLSGHLEEFRAINELSVTINMSYDRITEVLNTAREAMTPIQENIKMLSWIKSQNYNLACLSNCSYQEMAMLCNRYSFMQYFDYVLCSGVLKSLKPDKLIFERLLKFTNSTNYSTVYVDDDIKNVRTATSLGIQTIEYNHKVSGQSIKEYIKNINMKNKNSRQEYKKGLSHVINQAYNYLSEKADIDSNGLFKTTVTQGIGSESKKLSPSEIFSSINILQISKQISLSPRGIKILNLLINSHKDLKFKFFLDLNVIPYDLDTTSVALNLLIQNNLVNSKQAENVIQEMLLRTNDKGIFLTYFDQNRIRICPMVCSNVLHLLNYTKIGVNSTQSVQTKIFLHEYLVSKSYLSHKVYYPNPDLYLLQLSKLLYKFPEEFENFRIPLVNEVNSRIGSSHNSISLAARCISCSLLGIKNDVDFNELLSTQNKDGSWTESSLFSTSSQQVDKRFYWESRAFSTSLGLKAAELVHLGVELF